MAIRDATSEPSNPESAPGVYERVLRFLESDLWNPAVTARASLEWARGALQLLP